METQIKIAIVAHPARKEQAHTLAKQVNAYTVVMDEQRKGEQWTHQEALLRLCASSELNRFPPIWYILLEDDAIPCKEFTQLANDALKQAPADCVVSFYLGTGRWAGTVPKQQEPKIQKLIEEADNSGSDWIKASALWHAVGFAVPSCLVSDLLNHLHTDNTPTDQAVTHWMQARHMSCWYTYPSLINHADTTRLVQGKEPPVKRVACKFIDE